MQHIPNNNFDAYLYDALSNAGSAPPPDMWAHIACELPDAADLAFVGTLKDATAVVPQGIWDKIATQLDTTIENNAAISTEMEGIFGVLATYEVAPRAGIWADIEPNLPVEKIEDISFAALANHKVAPVVDFWSRIEIALDAPLEAELLPFAALATAHIAPNHDFWAAIAERLEIEDEMQQFSPLADYEVQPSADLWSRMQLPAENSNVLTQFGALTEYEVAPLAQNWDKIAAQLEKEEDEVAVLMNRLRHSEAEPATQIWARISEDLPLNPALRRHLTNFSRIAAVLLVAFTASVFYDNYNHYNNSDAPIAKTDPQNSSASLAYNGSNTTAKIAKTRRGNTKKSEPNNLNNINILDAENIGKNQATDKSSKTLLAQNETFAKIGNNKKAGREEEQNIFVSTENVSNSVSKSQKKQVINNGVSKSAFANIIPLGSPIDKSIASENRLSNNFAISPTLPTDNQRGLEIIEPLAPTLATNTLAKIDTELLPPSRFLDAQIQRLMLEAIATAMPSIDMNNNLRLQFDDKTITLGRAKIAELESYTNLANFRNDTPVEDLIAYKGWSVSANVQGILPSIYNNHILKTLTPIGGEVTQAISFRLGYGAAVGYQWAKRDGLGLEYNYTQQGQTYLRAASGKNTALNLNADYNRIAALYNRQVSLPTEKFGLSFVIGAQVGILNEASFKMDGDNTIQVKDIAKTDIGMIGGIDVNYFLSHQTVLSLGMRAAYSRDLSRFAVPDPLNNSTTAIRLGFTYRLK